MLRSTGAPRTPEGELYAAVHGCVDGAVASHLSAAALFGWRRHPAVPHVTVPYGAGTRGVAVVHRSRLDPVDATVVGVIPATTPARTLVDCAAVLRPDDLAELVDVALLAGNVRPGPVEAALRRASSRHGRKGASALRDALAAWAPGIERDSVAEARLFRLLAAWGFPPPATLHEVRTPDGRFVCELDVAWPEHLVALEYDSVAHHGPRRWARDEARCSGAAALGWTVVPVDKDDLRPGGHQRLRSTLDGLLRGRPGARARTGPA